MTVATKTVVADGDLDNSNNNNDRASLQIMNGLRKILRDLSQVYQTQRVRLLGYFNVELWHEDTNSGHNNKLLTSDLRQKIRNTYM
jgi:hypothetical protein